MERTDILVIAVVAAIIGLVVWYIHRSKKKGVKCIGCPDAAKCSGNSPPAPEIAAAAAAAKPNDPNT